MHGRAYEAHDCARSKNGQGWNMGGRTVVRHICTVRACHSTLAGTVLSVGTKGVSQYHLLSFDNNKVLKITNWIC